MSVNISDGSLNWRASIDLSGIKEQVGEINKMLGNVGGQLEKQSKDIDQFSRSAANAIKAYIGVTAIKGFVTDIVKVRGEFQQLEVAFQTMLGNKEKADALMAQVVDLAAKTPFGLQDAATGAKQLLAYGFAAENVTQNLTMLGDIASGVGSPLNDIVYLYGTLRTQGRAFQKDIMQFTGRGIPIIGELAKQFGVTEDKVSELVEAGKVGFPEIEKAFKSLTSEGGMFNNLMEAQSKTISGLIANFGDAWATMLNDIGKSQEGPIADIIKGGISIVENYEKVLDVLKVLVVSYGTYRAAVIATTVAQGIATSMTKGWTAAEILHYNAMVLSQRAMKILNATMLTNPFVAVSTAVVGLITALSIFGKTVSQTKDKAKLLADSQGRVAEKMSEAESKIRPYVDALKNANISEAERLNIYNKIKAIDPDIIKGLDAKTLSYQDLSTRVNEYLGKLREQYKLEANKEAIQDSIKTEQDLEKQRDDKLKKLEDYNNRIEALRKKGDKEGAGLAQFTVTELRTDIKVIEKDIERQKQITAELGDVQVKAETKKQEAKLRTLKLIDEEIAAFKKQQEETTNRGEYDAIQKKIDLLIKEREAITGNTKAAGRQEDKYSAMLEKRAKALNDIAELERNANQSGLLQKQKDLDVINEKYDKQLQSVQEINKEIAAYNAKNPNKKLSLLGDAETERINAARATEITNSVYRQDAENYLAALSEKKEAFDHLQEAQLSSSQEIVNVTRQQYSDQLQGFDSYAEYIKAQIALLSTTALSRPLNIGEATILEKLKTELIAANKEVSENNRRQSIEDYQSMIDTANTYTDRRLSIEAKYLKKRQALNMQQGKIDQKLFQERLEGLNQEQEQEMSDLADSILEGNSAWKKFNEGIENLSLKSLKSLKELLLELRKDMRLTEEQRKKIDQATKETGNEISQDQVQPLREISNILGGIGQEISISISGAFKTTTRELAQFASNIANLFDSGASKSSKNTSLVGVILYALGSIGKALNETGKSVDEAMADAKAANDIILYGIEKENEALEKQRKILEDTYGQQKIDGLLDLQNQLQQKTLDTISKLKGLDVNTIMRPGDDLSDFFLGSENGFDRFFDSLFGIDDDKYKYSFFSFDTSELETIEDYRKLLDEIKSNGGKLVQDLPGGGKSLLSVDESDIEALEEMISNYDELIEQQKELRVELQQIFTATTSSSITDSIIAGFKAGKRTIEDFAGDFEELMSNAVLNSLKYQTLEAPMQKFYEEFAEKSASDGILTGSEIGELKSAYQQIIEAAGQQFDNLQSITDLNLSGDSNSSNSLAGAIKGITEQQADLLAGQFGGLRMTALQQLDAAMSSLDTLNRIQANTEQLYAVRDILRRLEMHGIKVV